MKFKIIWIRPKDKIIYSKDLYHMEVRVTPVHKGITRFPYLVNINNIEIVFQFDPVTQKLYADEENSAKTNALMEKHAKKAKQMEDDGATEEEIRKYIAWKWVTYLDRQPYTVIIWPKKENIVKHVKNIIESTWI